MVQVLPDLASGLPVIVYGRIMDLDRLRDLAGTEQGLCVVSVVHGDGSPHASVVNAGVLTHPRDGGDVVGFVTRGGSVKHRRLRERAQATVTFRRGWRWAGVTGRVDLIGPDDPSHDIAVLPLLRAVFRAAGGTHDDWDEYDRVMTTERRVAVLVQPDRIVGSG